MIPIIFKVSVLVALCLLIVSPCQRVWSGTLVKIERNVFQIGLPSPTLPSLVVDGLWLITERVQNGSFKSGLDKWQIQGMAEVINEANTASFLRLGLGGLVTENTVAQSLSLTDMPPTHLVFEYRLLSQETLAGFDTPCFQVRANETIVFEQSCEGLSQTQVVGDELYKTSEWQRGMIDIRHWPDSTLNLSFWSGNTIDQEGNSGVELKNITTQRAYLLPSTEFRFNSESEVTYAWNNGSHVWQQGETFRLEPAETNLFSYGLTSLSSLTGQIDLTIDNSAPEPVEGFGYYQNADQSYSLTWFSTVPNLRYEVRQTQNWTDFFTKPWSNLEMVTLKTSDFHELPQNFSSATSEVTVFHLPPNLKGQWLAIKTKDAAGNYSELSQIVELR